MVEESQCSEENKTEQKFVVGADGTQHELQMSGQVQIEVTDDRMDLEITSDFSGILLAPSFNLITPDAQTVPATIDYLSSQAKSKSRYLTLDAGNYTLQIEGSKCHPLPVILQGSFSPSNALSKDVFSSKAF